MQIDLNCDMGEAFGPWPMGDDANLMPHISSANIACGFHAGDASVMLKTVRLALKNHVAIGAHPGFPDLQGFGRRNMQVSPEEVYAQTLYQIGALEAIVRAEGGQLSHVKPHGALYNMAAKDLSLAKAIAEATVKVNQNLRFFGLSGSALIEAGQAAGLQTCNEVFADRSYQDDGSLTPRSQPGALIEDVQKAVEQALQMVKNQSVRSVSGKTVPLRAETICLHGDGARALEFARAISSALKKEGYKIAPPQ